MTKYRIKTLEELQCDPNVKVEYNPSQWAYYSVSHIAGGSMYFTDAHSFGGPVCDADAERCRSEGFDWLLTEDGAIPYNLVQKCTCEIHLMMRAGCQCGAFAAEQRAKHGA